MTWGPWNFSCDVEGEAGVAVVSAVVFPNPPLIVELDTPGHVDVIEGIPPTWLNADVIDAFDHLEAQSTPHEMFRIVARLLESAGWIRGHRAVLLSPHLAKRCLPSFRSLQSPEPQEIPPQVLEELVAGGDGMQARRSREAEGISVRVLVERCSRLIGSSGMTTAERLRTFEAGGTTPPAVVAELDVALGLGGRLGPCVVATALNTCRVTFPVAYIGPVWLQLVPEAPDRSPTVEFRWGTYRKLIRPVQDARVWFTKSWPSDAALEVRARGWRVVAGIGRVPEAHDVHIDWSVDYRSWRTEILHGVKQFIMSRRATGSSA